jgi:hypothetical protein
VADRRSHDVEDVGRGSRGLAKVVAVPIARRRALTGPNAPTMAARSGCISARLMLRRNQFRKLRTPVTVKAEETDW